MSEKNDTPAKPKKGRGIIKLLVMGVLLAGAGGGTVFGLVEAGIIGNNSAKAKDAAPELVLKGSEDPYAPPAARGQEQAKPLVHGDGGSRYRTAYYTFDEEFTSNLKDSDALIQVSLAASTRRDGRVLMWLDEHKLAIRSQILITLGDTPEAELLSPEGKAHLQKRLTQAVNQVLTQQEGFGGVDNVYFKSFIVQ